jgi:hypothetical protein
MEATTHLSEEAINDVLIGMASPESELHLAVCPECRGQVQEFRSGMQIFDQASLAWSEARYAPALRIKTELGPRRIAVASPLWAIAATVLLAVGVPVWSHYHDSPRNPAPASAPADSEAQIAQDNELMHSVDIALSEDDESPIRAYRLSEGRHSHLSARPEMRKQ